MNGNSFVFVVCGGKEHVDTLHFSLAALKKFSAHKIYVLTDSSRNEIAVNHENVIDVKTPEELTHHQASIFLKTAIHRYLPKGNLYCYLDTDVVALSKKVDDIFSHYVSPVTFATDHCKMNKFSPYAVNCKCAEQNTKEQAELKGLLKEYGNWEEVVDERLVEKQRKLICKFRVIKQNKLKYLWILIRILLSPVVFKLDDDTFYHRWRKYWFDADKNPILYDYDIAARKVERKTKWKWRSIRRTWISPSGNDIYNLGCNHLQEQIKATFSTNISEDNWQHWNGGVFVFGDESHGFLDKWHEKTSKIFSLPQWKTRDQGTLIATAWEFGLQNQQTLPITFNFLADYHHPTMIYQGDLKFSFEDNATITQPHFIHIYHQWGNENWAVWRDVEHQVKHIDVCVV